jgi:hypothetical protein
MTSQWRLLQKSMYFQVFASHLIEKSAPMVTCTVGNLSSLLGHEYSFNEHTRVRGRFWPKIFGLN